MATTQLTETTGRAPVTAPDHRARNMIVIRRYQTVLGAPQRAARRAWLVLCGP